MRKMGGFFIWLSFLFLSCFDVQNDGATPVIRLQDDMNESEDLGVNNIGNEKKDPGNFQLADYKNYDFGFSLSYRSDWNLFENKDFDSEFILMLGNFVFDDLLHPKDGEVLVEGFKFLNEKGLDLWNFALEKRPYFKGVLIDFERNDDYLKLLFDCGQMPENFEGEWLFGYVEDYYFARNREIYFFSASVLERDVLFLGEFEGMMGSVEFEEEEDER